MSTPAQAVAKKADTADKLTIYIDRDVIKQLKHLAVDQERSLSQLAEELFKSFLANPNRTRSPKPRARSAA